MNEDRRFIFQLAAVVLIALGLGMILGELFNGGSMQLPQPAPLRLRSLLRTWQGFTDAARSSAIQMAGSWLAWWGSLWRNGLENSSTTKNGSA